MPQVSPQLEAARKAAHDRLNQLKGWLESEDVKAVADAAELAVGTVNQIKKGVKWNSQAVELLIQKAEERKLYYEKISGSRLNEETGKPFLSPSDESKPKKRRVAPVTT